MKEISKERRDVFDLDALLHPVSAFAHPMDVVRDPDAPISSTGSERPGRPFELGEVEMNRRTAWEKVLGLSGFLVSWLFILAIALSPPL